MNGRVWFAAASAAFSLAILAAAAGDLGSEDAGSVVLSDSLTERGPSVPKAGSAQTLGARGVVTASNAMYGGFELRAATVVYLIVRGNSLGSLGVTQGYLDAPRVRIYDRFGNDIAFDLSGNRGFNGCSASNTVSAPVRSFYGGVRAAPAADRDACSWGIFSAGVYTFSVTPSIPGVTTNVTSSSPPFGEVLFEVTFNP